MKNKHLKNIELLKYMFETLSEKKSKKVREHINQCEECKKRNEHFVNMFKPVSRTKEKPYSSEKINALYESFTKKLEHTNEDLPKRRWFLQPALGFSLTGLVLLIGIWFLTLPEKKPIKVINFENPNILINGEIYNLSLNPYLPLNKVITTQGDLDISIKKTALAAVCSNTKFKIVKKENYVFSLLNGKIRLKTLKKKNIHVKVNYFLIKPIGTIFQVSYADNILRVFLLKGRLEIENLINKKIFVMTPLNDIFIYDFKNNTQLYDKPSLSKIQLKYFNLGMKYQKLEKWKKAIYWYNKFIKESPEETDKKYEALYNVGIIYYRNLNNKKEAEKYFKEILSLKVFSEFKSKIPLEILSNSDKSNK